jgi:predicted Fe-Mo cluster-binding NifX family protein
MKIAIPVFNDRVSPRFEFAPHFLLFSVEGERVIARETCDSKEADLFQRVKLLQDYNIDVLICGGIHCFSRRLLDGNRVEVLSSVFGTVEEVLARYLQGDLLSLLKAKGCTNRRSRCKANGDLVEGCRASAAAASAATPRRRS